MGKRLSSGLLHKSLINLRSSFWFLPTLLVVSALALAPAVVALDRALGDTPGERWPLLFTVDADGARELLSTIAGSMITVAGVVFSITIAALVQAASQYTSRVLRNFMRDRGNQVVLGVFLAVFTYCLVVLRTITTHTDDGGFVPQVAVTTGVALAMVAVGFLVYFIHHVAASIQSGAIARGIARDTLKTIDEVYPHACGAADAPADTVSDDDLAWHPVAAPDLGYIESVDFDALVEFARRHGVVVRVESPLGAFASPERPIASIGATRAPDREMRERLACLFAIGSYRTIDQDVAFGLRQLVDVALKGLSPAINDTTTAVTALDYISVILQCLAGRQVDPRPISDAGRVRVLPAGPDFERLLALGFDQILENAEGNTTVLLRMLEAIGQIRVGTRSPRRHAVLDAKREVIAGVARRTAANAGAQRLIAAALDDARAGEDTSGA